MARKTLRLDFVFDEHEEDDGDTTLELYDIFIGTENQLSPKERAHIAEAWAQSDRYWVDITSKILNVIDHPDF